jgi:hypothetical protein
MPSFRREHLSLPHVARPKRLHGRYERPRRRPRTAEVALRILSVPVSIGLGMLIAHLLY